MLSMRAMGYSFESAVADIIDNSISADASRISHRFGIDPVEFENAIEWLVLSSIVSRVYRAEQAKKPLENYRDIDAFKTYVSDVGLLGAKKEIIPEDILYPTHDLDDFKGGMTENYVCNQLVGGGHSCYYWTGDHSYEVDFLVQLDGAVVCGVLRIGGKFPFIY